jgi:hypothetical protein
MKMVHPPELKLLDVADSRFPHLENYAIQNKVFSVLLGDAVPEELEGTTDDNYYNHYRYTILFFIHSAPYSIVREQLLRSLLSPASL